MNKEIKQLQKENDLLHKSLCHLIYNKLTIKEQEKLFNLILNIVDNEIRQEKLCNQ